MATRALREFVSFFSSFGRGRGRNFPRRDGVDLRSPPSRRLVSGLENAMLYWAAVFFIIAIIAGFLGFGGVSVAASGIAQTLFFIFLVIFIVALVMGMARRRSGPI
jgi:uncharacterized membrane protein YtjA (UPF0391 family)